MITQNLQQASFCLKKHFWLLITFFLASSGVQMNGLIFLKFIVFLEASELAQGSTNLNIDCPDLYTRNASAPQDGREPATQKCFLDCIRDPIITIICEDIDVYSFPDSTNFIPDSHASKSFDVLIINSPKLKYVDDAFLGTLKLKFRMNSLRLLNVATMNQFPMLRDRKNITEYSIENAPSLKVFASESLPLNIKRLVIFETGITMFTADLNEVQPRNSLTELIFSRQKVTVIGKRIMTLFPQLTSFSFMYNNISLTQVPQGSFFHNQKLDRLIFRENNFSNTSDDLQKDFLQMFLSNFSLTENSVVDISYNGLPLNCTPQYCYSLNNVSALSLAGNSFGQFFTADGLFAMFNNLKRLDVSNTNFPRRKGALRGLSKLEMLVLSGNTLQDLVRTDIFFGCEARPQILDLSNNGLLRLPDKSFKNLTSSIMELYLGGNFFHDLILFADIESCPSPLPDDYDFGSLRTLDLSRSGLRQFKGAWVAGSTKLINLDVSCNSFVHISRQFFAGLPSSLQVLNMSFCVTVLKSIPVIDKDAFSSLGENNTQGSIKQLIMSSSHLKGWIFTRLLQMPNQTRAGLETLDLSDNRIYYLDSDLLAGFKELTTLNLAGNYLQQIGKGTFTPMTKLASLNLARNKLASVQDDELVGMQSLTFLDLSSNKLLHVDDGAFDNVPELQSLYLGKNLQLKSLNNMFDIGGQNLVHLGIAGNPFMSVTNFPDACINQVDLATLSSLKYIYIDNGTAIFVDQGNTDTALADSIRGSQIWPKDPEAMQCEFGIPNVTTSAINIGTRDLHRQAVPVCGEPSKMTAWTDDFTRLIMHTPLDNLPRTFVTHIPKCHSHAYRSVALSTASFFCPQFDDKTFKSPEETGKTASKKGKRGKH